MNTNDFWIWAGRVADILGTISVLATLGFAVATYYLIKRGRKKYLQQVRDDSPTFDDFESVIAENDGINSLKPVALIVALTPSNDTIAPNVDTFLNFKNWRMPKKEVKMNGINSNEDLKKFIADLTAKKREITAEEFTEVHLFITAPMFACVLTGSLLKHWLPTKIYHKPTPVPPSFYIYQTPLI